MKRLREFKCSVCGRVFERRVQDTRTEAQHCPNCGGDAYRRLAVPAVHFHGDGFTKSVRGNK